MSHHHPYDWGCYSDLEVGDRKWTEWDCALKWEHCKQVMKGNIAPVNYTQIQGVWLAGNFSWPVRKGKSSEQLKPLLRPILKCTHLCQRGRASSLQIASGSWQYISLYNEPSLIFLFPFGIKEFKHFNYTVWEISAFCPVWMFKLSVLVQMFMLIFY